MNFTIYFAGIKGYNTIRKGCRKLGYIDIENIREELGVNIPLDRIEGEVENVYQNVNMQLIDENIKK